MQCQHKRLKKTQQLFIPEWLEKATDQNKQSHEK